MYLEKRLNELERQIDLSDPMKRRFIFNRDGWGFLVIRAGEELQEKLCEFEERRGVPPRVTLIRREAEL